MAKILNKDPATYLKERDEFLRELRQFHESRGTPFRRVPKIHGHEVDLYLLYVLVTAHGGWEKVNNRSEWDTLSEQFKVPKNCVNGGIALKQIYIRFLERYEKLHFLGEDVDRDDDDDDESRSSSRRWSRVVHNVPLSYNHNQHNITEQARQTLGFSSELFKPSEYDRLSLSLMSPLPNEHDFALNVCTLLSNEGKHTLRLEKNPRLIEFILAHAGVFANESLEDTFTSMYNYMRRQAIDKFWTDVVSENDFRELRHPAKKLDGGDVRTSNSPAIEPKDRLQDGLENKTVDSEMVDLTEQTDKTDNNNKCKKIRMVDVPDDQLPILPDKSVKAKLWPCESDKMEIDKLSFNQEDCEIFCLGRGLGTQDPLGQRVLQVATIMRNLSFEDDNIPVLGRSVPFIRFAILCVHSKYNSLSQLGLDMLGQIAGELILDPETDPLAGMLINTISKGLTSSDRFRILSCLEVLNKLSQKEENEEVMLKYLEQPVYDKICSFLTLHDIMLLIYTLECLYSLSSLGERACNSIVRVHGAVDTLVSLVTVEAQSYGPRACILMRVVERIPEQSVQSAAPATNQTPTITQLTNVQSTPTRVPIVTPRPAIVNTTPQRTVQTIAVSTTGSVPTIIPGPQQLQHQHQQQQLLQENEQFALMWLRTTYEPANGQTVEQNDLYRQYVSSCAKLGRKGVIAQLHFPRCVRSVFGGTVGPNAKQSATGGPTEYHYDGIKVRKSALQLLANPPAATSNVVVRTQPQSIQISAPESTPASPAVAETVPPATSPILKAQLSAPPKPRDIVKPEAKSQVLAHPHLTQALLGSQSAQQQQSSQSSPSPASSGPTSPTPSTSSSSLIKSLLASKVNIVAESMSMPNIMTTPADVHQHQVAQRQMQQKLLLQQQQIQPTITTITTTTTTMTSPPPLQITNTSTIKPPQEIKTTPVVARVNGARPLVASVSQTNETTKDNEEKTVADSPSENHVDSKVNDSSLLPPPPPKPKIDEDSNSTANSHVSSTGATSTDGDGENSLTSFEGLLLNGIPHALDIDANNDSSDPASKLSDNKTSPVKTKGMLADLLEKKVPSKEPVINGVLGKEIRISDKGLEIVENHVAEKLDSVNKPTPEQIKSGLKRISTSSEEAQDAKKPLMSPPINGNAHTSETNPNESGEKTEIKQEASVITQAPPAIRQLVIAQPPSNTTAPHTTVENSASTSTAPVTTPAPAANPQQQVFFLNKNLLMQPGQRQVVMQNQQVLVSGGQVLSQVPMLVTTQSGGGQLILTQALQGGNPGQAYVVAQPSGQTPTVLVTQTPQQQGTNAKTIIILHQQPGQKLPTQGQQVMVQLPRSAVQGTALQGVTLSQGAGGQVTVSLPGNVIARSVATTSGTNLIQSVVKTVTNKPVAVATPAIVQNPIRKPGVITNVTTVKTTQPNATVQLTPTQQQTPSKPTTPRTSTETVENANQSSSSSPPPLQSPQRPIDISNPFLCEWRGCMRTFKSANEVYMHACQAHCPTGTEELQCLWERCDGMKRKRFSLMTHLYDRHCNNDVLRMMAVRRKQMATSGRSEIPAPTPPPPHPGYAPNAALHAIKRHALEFVNPKELMQRASGANSSASSSTTTTTTTATNTCTTTTAISSPSTSTTTTTSSTPRPPTAVAIAAATTPVIRPADQTADPNASRRLSFQDDNEGPVTKSIRLTSSLILRNLVIFSTNGRRFLRSYEPHLAGVALSNVESSRTIAQLLYDMSQQTTEQS